MCDNLSFVLSFRALSITNSKHSANKMHNAVPYIFVLHHHTEHSYMFRSANDHHHGSKPKKKRLIRLYETSRWFGSLIMMMMMMLARSKHVGMFSVSIKYKYPRNSVLQFVE